MMASNDDFPRFCRETLTSATDDGAEGVARKRETYAIVRGNPKLDNAATLTRCNAAPYAQENSIRETVFCIARTSRIKI